MAELMRNGLFTDKFVFVEDYDINVGRYFVKVSDVWLNNLAASPGSIGTSGQKVVLNGGLNLVLDGWWARLRRHEWIFHRHGQNSIQHERPRQARRRGFASHPREEVIPCTAADRDGLPRGWISA